MAEQNSTVCGADLKSMEEWTKEKGETCRPCVIPVTMQWYFSELKDKGWNDQAAKIEAAQDIAEMEAVGKVLDEIKAEVSPEMRDRLLEFDCATQQIKPSDLHEEETSDVAPLDSPTS